MRLEETVGIMDYSSELIYINVVHCMYIWVRVYAIVMRNNLGCID